MLPHAEGEDPQAAVRRAAQQAGLPLPEERLEGLVQALPLVRAGAEALASLDLGEREPASAFRAPKE